MHTQENNYSAYVLGQSFDIEPSLVSHLGPSCFRRSTVGIIEVSCHNQLQFIERKNNGGSEKVSKWLRALPALTGT